MAWELHVSVKSGYWINAILLYSSLKTDITYSAAFVFTIIDFLLLCICLQKIF